MKDIKDYVHFYIGCDAQVKTKQDTDYTIGRICEVTSKSNHGDWIKVWFENPIYATDSTWETSYSNQHHYFFGHDHIKLVLRPLSDITEDEDKEASARWFEECEWQGGTDINVYAVMTNWYRKRGFDVDNLIESGLAIDKTKI